MRSSRASMRSPLCAASHAYLSPCCLSPGFHALPHHSGDTMTAGANHLATQLLCTALAWPRTSFRVQLSLNRVLCCKAACAARSPARKIT